MCIKSRQATRLTYRTQPYRGRTGEKKGFRAREFASLLSATANSAVRTLLCGTTQVPTVPVHALREFRGRSSARHTIHRLPPYAPELDPVKGAWDSLKKNLANLAPHSIEELDPLVKRRLRHLPQHPALLDGFVAGTGLRPGPP
ncbi:transposase [Streptomyces sp. ActVer]|uniref:transposase n=1 Tax=Streptomyces sp. ActVer TaxID=3014558 RepID=UPI0022B41101|nr:transposase [Streptomyces sp. ActVer]MCZ4515226.1 transposase [Streptomyces sp. ActVer]